MTNDVPKATVLSPRPPLVRRLIDSEWLRRGVILVSLLATIITLLCAMATQRP